MAKCKLAKDSKLIEKLDKKIEYLFEEEKDGYCLLIGIEDGLNRTIDHLLYGSQWWRLVEEDSHD